MKAWIDCTKREKSIASFPRHLQRPNFLQLCLKVGTERRRWPSVRSDNAWPVRCGNSGGGNCSLGSPFASYSILPTRHFLRSLLFFYVQRVESIPEFSLLSYCITCNGSQSSLFASLLPLPSNSYPPHASITYLPHLFTSLDPRYVCHARIKCGRHLSQHHLIT